MASDNLAYGLAGVLGGAVIAYFVLTKAPDIAPGIVQSLPAQVQEVINPYPIIDPNTVFNALQTNAYNGSAYSSQTVPMIQTPGDAFNVGNGLADQIPIGTRFTLP